MYKILNNQQLILASSSPRRRELLSACDISFSIEIPDCDETVIKGESEEQLVRRLSLLKANTVASKFPTSWILAADTVVAVDGEILGKPADKEDAFLMLQKIQNRWHEVWGGIAFINLARSIEVTEVYCTKVKMRSLTETEIKQYVASGEPMDKAGAYAIQDIGASLVREMEGSYTNVVGLNLSAVITMLKSQKLF